LCYKVSPIKILVKIAFFLLKTIKNGWGRLGTVEDGGRWGDGTETGLRRDWDGTGTGTGTGEDGTR
jgi:hypothetical protein